MADHSFAGPSARQLRDNRNHSHQHLRTLMSTTSSGTTSLCQSITPRVRPSPCKPTRPPRLRRATTFITSLTTRPQQLTRHSSLQLTDGENQAPKTGKKVKRRYVKNTHEEGDAARVDRWRNEVADVSSSSSSSSSAAGSGSGSGANGERQRETFEQSLVAARVRIGARRGEAERRVREYDSDIYDEDEEEEAALHDVERNGVLSIEEGNGQGEGGSITDPGLVEAMRRKTTFEKLKNVFTWQKQVKFGDGVMHAPAVVVANAAQVLDPFADANDVADDARANLTALPIVIGEVEVSEECASSPASSRGLVHPYQGWMVVEHEVLIEDVVEEERREGEKEKVFADIWIGMRQRLGRLRGVFGKNQERALAEVRIISVEDGVLAV